MVVGIHTSQLVLDFIQENKRVASLWLWAVAGMVPIVVCVPNNISDYWTFLDGVLEGVLSGYSLALFGDFDANMGNDSWKEVIRRNGLHDLNPNGVGLIF